MPNHFTRLQDISRYQVQYKPQSSRPALWDCPKVIRDAANGKPPELLLSSLKEIFAVTSPLLLAMGVGIGIIEYQLLSMFPHWIRLGLLFGIPVAFLAGLPFLSAFLERKDYGLLKELFDAYTANPELYRDEIYKAAVNRLPNLDFQGKHRLVQDAYIGKYESDVIEILRRMGIRQEATVANRGRPFLIHQYELTELKWGKWDDGGTKNYTIDLAILWPERRIKYAIEIDGSSHHKGNRPFKDIQRDEVMTERGWFVRRLNHNFISEGLGTGKVEKALGEIVSIVYFFAKYANNEEFNSDGRIVAALQERRFKQRHKKARAEKAEIVRISQSEIADKKVGS